MANNENLKRLTPSEAREYGRKGGKASGKARRRRADFKKTLNLLLTAEIANEEWTPVLNAMGLDSTLESAMMMSMIKAALEGDVKAAYFVAQYAGQDNKTDLDIEEQEARISKAKATLDEGESDMADDGFMDALNGTAAEDWTDEEES